MGVVDASGHGPDRTARAVRLLSVLAHDLAGEFRLMPLLQRILANSCELLECHAGSICLVDTRTHTYRKEIDTHHGCKSGEVFSLDEGMTGLVTRSRAPVILPAYSQVPHGHVEPGEPRYNRAVIGIPVMVKQDVIGCIVVFAPDEERRFGTEDIAVLEGFATHAAVAIANSRLHAEAAERATEAAIVHERERAMQEIHDTLGRGLESVLLLIEKGDGDALAQARDLARSALEEGRRAVRGLGAGILDAKPLDEALRLELDWTLAATGIEGSLTVYGTPRTLPREVSFQLLRIAQEALSNVAQHADARRIRAGLVYGAESVAVIVEDDGRGFDVQFSSDGIGLSGLVSRAAQVGGRVRVDSTPGWGTTVRADLPYRHSTGSEASTPRVRVAVVHPQPLLRAGLVRTLERTEPGVQVVAELAEFDAAVESVRLLRPRVVVLAARPGHAHVVADITAASPDTAVVALVPSNEHDAREWAAEGVRGLVPESAEGAQLGRAVVAAARGDALVTSNLLERLGGGGVPLTPREHEIRLLVEQGLADKQIARRLGISVKTVEKHVSSILRKADVRSRVELIATL